MSTHLILSSVIFVSIAFILVGVFLLTKYLGPNNTQDKLKNTVYESGVSNPVGTTNIRFSIKFYLVAIGFLLFDVEIIFMFPWAVNIVDLGYAGLVKMFIFIGLLFAGLIYMYKKKGVIMGLGAEANLGDSIITTKLDEAVNWARSYSMWPMAFGTACCGIEFMSVAASKYDVSRFGAEVVRFSPRQADLLIVAGTISYKQAPVLKKIWDQMCEPKWVISMGACACSGGFYDNYTTLQGIDEIIPVHEYISGCPPRPEAVLDAIMNIQKKSYDESIIKERDQNFKGILDA